jgi:hypothetical protein
MLHTADIRSSPTRKITAYLGALLPGYYTGGGRLIYAGRVGTRSGTGGGPKTGFVPKLMHAGALRKVKTLHEPCAHFLKSN